MKASTRQVDGVTVVDLSDRLKEGEDITVLRDTIEDLLGKGQKKILLNLGDVNHIDSSGVGALLRAPCFGSQPGRRVEAAAPDQEGPRHTAKYEAAHSLRRKGRRGRGDSCFRQLIQGRIQRWTLAWKRSLVKSNKVWAFLAL